MGVKTCRQSKGFGLGGGLVLCFREEQTSLVLSVHAGVSVVMWVGPGGMGCSKPASVKPTTICFLNLLYRIARTAFIAKLMAKLTEKNSPM